MSDFDIKHQPQQQAFYVDFEDSQRASLRYRMLEPESPATVDFFSTFVPDNQRGKGVAAELVDHGFAWATENNLKIETSCWYAKKRIKGWKQD